MREWWGHILKGPIPASLLLCTVFLAIAAWLRPAEGTSPVPSVIYETSGALQLEEGGNVTAALVGTLTAASVHHLHVVDQVRAHYHQEHDETVTVLAGEGMLTLGDEQREVGAGTVVVIPRGIVHSLRVTGEPVEAISVFSPSFDGEDRIFLDE